MKKIIIFIILTTLTLAFTVSLCGTTIYDIQHTEEEIGDSPLMDQTITVTGIVTATGFKSSGNSNRFFMCDLPEIGTGAWHGIFVFNFDTIVQAGDEVTVTGKVVEFYNYTELTGSLEEPLVVTINSSGNTVPEPVNITTAEMNHEKYEGVLCSLLNVTVVEPIIEHGQWYVNDGSGACQIDDGFFKLEDENITISEGDTWGQLTGVVDYSFNEFGLHPRTPADMIQAESVDSPELKNQLIGNYPNPFNPTTEINFDVRTKGNVEISIFNLKGQKIKTLVNKEYTPTIDKVTWNGKDDNNKEVSSGIYYYRMKSGKYTTAKKMILLK